VIVILTKIYGNISGIKTTYLERLEKIYELQIGSRQLVSSELIDELAFLSDELNREIAVYINRKGQILQVSVGQHNKVALVEMSQRRGTDRLSKIRCIHTHPNSSGFLSAVDINSLHQLRFDCMTAIGVNKGTCSDIWVGFINPEGTNKTLSYGPFDCKSIISFDFLSIVEDIDKKIEVENEVAQETKERALLVGVEFFSHKSEIYDARDSLEELEGLAEAAGAIVVDKVFQSRNKPDSAYYIGSGLVENLALKAQALKAKLIIIDGELSGSQQRNLENSLGTKVVDRTSLILDIFAQRAKSKEGKLQIELAQLEYLLPKLIGSVELGLSRLAGGIGTRGPGESKLEQDRRRIRARIADLKKELLKVEERRNLLKDGRNHDKPVVALVGYTNSGKSTLRYKLLQDFATHHVNWKHEDAGTNQLFATLDSTVRGIVLPNGSHVLLADTVGFIQRLPHKLISAFKATLEEVVEADLLLHIVDVSNPNYEQQILAVDQVLAELKITNKKIILVYNKVDLVTKEKLFFNPCNLPSVEISALTGQGLEDLLVEIQNTIGLKRVEVKLAIPYTESKLVSNIHEEGIVKKVEYKNDAVILNAIVNQSLYRTLKQYII
jgi:GTP-binding protein HflX